MGSDTQGSPVVMGNGKQSDERSTNSSYNNLMTRPLDMGILGTRTRYRIVNQPSNSNAIISWKSGFEVESGPSVIIQDNEGRERPLNDEDFLQRPIAGSDAIDSDETSAIVSVYDLGFSAAAKSSHGYELDRKESSGTMMDSEEVCRQLQLSPQPGTSVEQSIRRKLQENLVKSKLDDDRYLPIDIFERILTPKLIRSLMNETFSHSTCTTEMNDLTTEIVGDMAVKSRRRILAILILMERVHYISRFIDKGIRDGNLPLRRSQHDIGSVTNHDPEEEQPLLDSWSMNEVELFYVYQKMLFVPFFDIQEDSLNSYHLDREIRLPWQHYEPKTSGGNGLVHKLQIHPTHHNFKTPKDSDGSTYFALKEIESINRETYRRELSALERACAQIQKEKHLIKLLLTFRHGDKYYLLFEWADGNLMEFWEKKGMPTLPMDSIWAAEQCLGISSAIKRIHGLTTWQKSQRSSMSASSRDGGQVWGRHGDIKPENILWFSNYDGDYDHLVVSDLGLTRYHSHLTRSQVPVSNIEGYTWAYRPPEMEMGFSISQKYDVWSLGCVYLEFLIWHLEGFGAVHEFGNRRLKEEKDHPSFPNVMIDNYYHIIDVDDKHKEAYIKKAVREKISDLYALDTCTQFGRKMLHIIETGMLVIKVEERWKIDRICTEISSLIRRLSNPREAEESRNEPMPSPEESPEENHGARSDETIQSDGEPVMLGIDALVQHAEGNFETASVAGRARAMSLHTSYTEAADERPQEQDESEVGPDDPHLEPQFLSGINSSAAEISEENEQDNVGQGTVTHHTSDPMPPLDDISRADEQTRSQVDGVEESWSKIAPDDGAGESIIDPSTTLAPVEQTSGHSLRQRLRKSWARIRTSRKV